MAMVKCPDCGKMVSEMANACPGCGRPMNRGTTTVKASGTVTIQKTSKMIKGCGCMSVLIMLLAICVAVAEHAQASISGSETSYSISTILLGIGICGFIVSRIAKWWKHD